MATLLDSQTFFVSLIEDNHGIVDKESDSFSGESNNGVIMNIRDSPDCTTEIDSPVNGMQEIVEIDSDSGDGVQKQVRCSSTSENSTRRFSNVNEKQEVIFFEIEEKQEIVENESDFVSESGNGVQKKARCSPGYENSCRGFSGTIEKQEMMFSENEEKQEIAECKSGNEVQIKMIDSIGVGNSNGSFAGVEESVNHEKESFLVFPVAKEEKDLSENELDSSSEFQESGNSNNSLRDSDNKLLESISQTQNLVEVLGDLICSENNLEILLDGKEKHYLVETELGSIPEAQTSGVKMVDFKNPGESSGNSSAIKERFEILLQINEKHGTVEIETQNAYGKQSNGHGYGNLTSEIKEMKEMVKNDGQKMNVFKENEEHVENSLQSKGKCKTPVTHFHPVSASGIGNDCKKDRGFMDLGKSSDMNEKNFIKQEMVLKKEKCSKRRAKGIKKVSEMNGEQNVLSLLAKAKDISQNKGDGTKRSYSRTELEALRFMNGDKQQVIWKKIYLGLPPVVAREFDNMANSMHQKQGCRNVDHHRHFVKKKEAATNLSIMAVKGKREPPANLCMVKNG